MDRITAIRKSLTGFVCGLFGWIPVLGIVPAVAAFCCWHRVQRDYHDWNPARKYLLCGVALSVVGLISAVILLAALLMSLLL
jgi:hypothetical protein